MQQAMAIKSVSNNNEAVSLSCGAIHIEHKVDLEGNRIATILRSGSTILGLEFNGQTYSSVWDEHTRDFLSQATNNFVQKIVQADSILNEEQLKEFVSQYIED